MAPKHVVKTDKAPAGMKGIFNQAIVANGMLIEPGSGSIAMDPATGKVIDGDVQAHTHQVIKNLTAVLEAAGTTPEHVVKVNVFLADMKDFAAMNEVYTQYWGEEKPCRTCVAVKQLPMGTDVEIEVSSRMHCGVAVSKFAQEEWLKGIKESANNFFLTVKMIVGFEM